MGYLWAPKDTRDLLDALKTEFDGQLDVIIQKLQETHEVHLRFHGHLKRALSNPPNEVEMRFWTRASWEISDSSLPPPESQLSVEEGTSLRTAASDMMAVDEQLRKARVAAEERRIADYDKKRAMLMAADEKRITDEQAVRTAQQIATDQLQAIALAAEVRQIADEQAQRATKTADEQAARAIKTADEHAARQLGLVQAMGSVLPPEEIQHQMLGLLHGTHKKRYSFLFEPKQKWSKVQGVDECLLALGDASFSGKCNVSHIVWKGWLAANEEHSHPHIISAVYKALYRVYEEDERLCSRLKQLNVCTHLRKGIPPDVYILYGKLGCVSADILTKLVAGL